jgi:iron complex transport system substrate-binding protein
MGPNLSRRRLLSAGLGAAVLATAGRGGAAPAAGRVVTDMAGRRVTVPARIERIASAGGSPAVNAFLFLFGMGPRIVTGLPPIFQGMSWRFQRLFAPGLEDKPIVSGPPPAWAPNVEALLGIRPDIAFVVGEPAAALLERAGLTAVVLKWEREDSIERTVRLLAEIFDAEATARDYFAWEAALQARIDRATATVPRRPRVLYLRYSTLTQPIMVPANKLIARAGGESVTARDNPLGLDTYPFSIEQVLLWQPEVMLLAFAEEIERVYADPRLAGLPAVRDRRVYGVPHGAHIWTHYTPEQPLGALWLAQKLQPGRLGGPDELREQTRQFYRRFFGQVVPDSELSALLV